METIGKFAPTHNGCHPARLSPGMFGPMVMQTEPMRMVRLRNGEIWNVWRALKLRDGSVMRTPAGKPVRPKQGPFLSVRGAKYAACASMA